MIYWIEWLYGSGKTSYATYLMMNEFKHHTIWTNIQVDQKTIPNAIIFPDRDILEVMRTINILNDLERWKYSIQREWSNIMDHDRSSFSNHVIFFDEWSSHINARDWKASQTALFQYLDQERKLFLDIYIMTPSSQTIDISYRRMIQSWITLEQFASLPILRNIRTARAIYKDVNGNPLTETFLDKDEMWTPIMKQRPIIESMGWFYAPKYWKHYDDLHKNISDDFRPDWFYKSIVNDWKTQLEEEERQANAPKNSKYLEKFRWLFSKEDTTKNETHSLQELEATYPEEQNQKGDPA